MDPSHLQGLVLLRELQSHRLGSTSALAAVAAARRAFEQEHYDACTELGFAYDGFEAREVTRTLYQVTFVHRQYYDEEIVAASAEEAIAKRNGAWRSASSIQPIWSTSARMAGSPNSVEGGSAMSLLRFRPSFIELASPERKPTSGIVQGNCVTVMQGMATGSVDMILTDPPYLVSYRDRSGRTLANDNNPAFVRPALSEMGECSTHDGVCILFCGWAALHHFAPAWTAAGFAVKGSSSS